jgi:hypothetical protein
MDTILGRQNVQQLPADQQQQARSEAMRRFVLGSLLGGRGLASGYSEAQQVIPGIQAANQQRRIGQAIDQSMVLQDPTNIGLTQTGPGSQADLLAQENAAFGFDPVVQQQTVQALQSNPNLPRQLNPRLLAQNMAPLVAGSDPSKAISLFQSTAPVFDSTTGTMRDPMTGQLVGSIEQEGRTPGTGTQIDPRTGQLVIRALPNAARAAEEARPIDLAQGEIVIGRDFQGNPIVRNAQGVIEARFQRESATAQGQATGQVERVFDPMSQTEVVVPRSLITGGGGGMGGGAGGQGGVGGFATGPGLNEQVLQQAGGEAFVKRVARVNEVGQDAGQRAFRANELYNTVSEIDPTALTAIGATVVPYIRAIPGFREITDNFATNTALLGQQYARGALGNFAMVKGNLNAQEVRLVENATWQKWDPRTATRYIAALEAAFADKDASQMEFANTYQGDFREYDSSWRNSPQNQSVFNHPMMTRFVTDEINEAITKTRPGSDPNFNLPPGFSVEGMTRDGGIQVKKPDGSVFVVR